MENQYDRLCFLSCFLMKLLIFDIFCKKFIGLYSTGVIKDEGVGKGAETFTR